MEEQVKLLVDIVEERPSKREMTVKSEMFDGTEFTIIVPSWTVEKIDSEKKNRGWLGVISQGRDKTHKVSITLPHPILSVGHHVNVDIGRIK